ncbi:hypothetical protein TNCT_211971 [Trichonephila clavata]|uniref:Uncharacterized protein n=1 Tax=Trichonephila clavata TaxID=2740835 RepID=A0A8X6K5X4_TRICU|nr:hypothetical protein TNCT_211971 [Trichonephila clavata]
MVRSIKQKCLGKACVTYEKMLTLLCEGESVINERHLTYLPDDPNEITSIAPGSQPGGKGFTTGETNTLRWANISQTTLELADCCKN